MNCGRLLLLEKLFLEEISQRILGGGGERSKKLATVPVEIGVSRSINTSWAAR